MKQLCVALVALLFTFLSSRVEARPWKDKTGAFSVEAELVAVADGKVKLKRADNGQIIEVPLDRLSDPDREYLASSGKLPAGAATAGSAGGKSTRELLDAKASFRFDKTPLDEALASLKVPYFLDETAIREAGVTRNMPLSATSGAGTLLDNLDRMLAPVHLAADFRHDVLFVTTIERQESLMHARFYRLKAAGNARQVAAQIQKEVAPNSWDKVGGPAHANDFGTSVLVIAQSQANHRIIETKYGRQLALVTAAKPGGGAPPAPTKGPSPVARLKPVLSRPVTIDFTKLPLQEAIARIAQDQKIKLSLDMETIEKAGVSPDNPVTARYENLPLESALSILTHPFRISWMAEGDALVVTTHEACERKLITVTYDVREIVTAIAGRGLVDFDTLVDGITSTVTPAAWDDVGGPASADVVNGNLVVKHTLQTHRIVEAWLADARAAVRPGRTGK